MDDFDEKPKPQFEHGGYVFKIVLQSIRPQIWRRFKAPAGISFHTRHNIIQVVMGWENYHLYHFDVGETSFTTEPMATKDLYSDEPIDAYLAEVGYQFFYEYDFGDPWEHVLTLEKFLMREVLNLFASLEIVLVHLKIPVVHGFTMNFYTHDDHERDGSRGNGNTASAITGMLMPSTLVLSTMISNPIGNITYQADYYAKLHKTHPGENISVT